MMQATQDSLAKGLHGQKAFKYDLALEVSNRTIMLNALKVRWCRKFGQGVKLIPT